LKTAALGATVGTRESGKKKRTKNRKCLQEDLQDSILSPETLHMEPLL
jgi:hypothetical protein